MKTIRNLCALGVLLVCIGCNTDSDSGGKKELPDTIVTTNPGLYPEGIAYDPEENVFYTTSMKRGQIVKVTAEGESTVVVDDPDLISGIGLKINKDRNQLIVCNGDPGVSEKTSPDTFGTLAKLGIYDLTTGEREALIDLAGIAPPGGHSPNDIAFDKQGNMYVTDSFSPIIYKITPDGIPSIFVTNELLGTDIGFGLNGIVYHPDGYLIAGLYETGVLYKISIENPEDITRIKVDGERLFIHADGLLLLNKKTLAIVTNNEPNGVSKSGVHKVRSHDDWNTATAVAQFRIEDAATFPTTLTKAHKAIYVVYGYLGVLFTGNVDEIQEFTIQKVTF